MTALPPTAAPTSTSPTSSPFPAAPVPVAVENPFLTPVAALPAPATTGYSRHDEEAVLQRYFAAHPPQFGRRLVDFGAWDGIGLSSTHALVKQGWNAALVEPSPQSCANLIDNSRGQRAVRVVNAFVVGASSIIHPSRLTVLQSTGDACSTTDPLVYTAHKSVTKYFPCMVPVLRLSEFLLAFPGPFDLVVLGTHGESCDLFSDLIEHVNVSVIVVDHSPGGHRQLPTLRALAKLKGYLEISVNQTNVIFGQEVVPTVAEAEAAFLQTLRSAASPAAQETAPHTS